MMNRTNASLSNTVNTLLDTGIIRPRAALTVQIIRHGPPLARVSIMGRVPVERPTMCGRVVLKPSSVLPDQRACSNQAGQVVLMSHCCISWQISHGP